MLVFLRSLPSYLDDVNDRIGRILAWTPLLLILVQFLVVAMVYIFGIGSIGLQESLAYINALMFLGGAGYTALHDEHVRVDILYSRLTPKGQALVRLCGTLGLLVPFLILFWITAIPYALESWAIREASVEASGLPFLYLLKSTLLLFPLTLSLAGLSDLIRAVRDLRRRAAR